MALYKFMEKQHASALLERGVIRIGTISDFRHERHKDGVRDEQEGKKLLYSHIADQTITKESAPKWFERFIALNNIGSVHLKNCAFQTNAECPDYYVLCLSTIPDADTTSMAALPGDYDTCVEVINPRRFFQKLRLEMLARFRAIYCGSHNVWYRDRVSTHDADDGTFPGLIKANEFESQREHRALWRPTQSAIIRPQILEIPSLARYCAEHKL